MRQTYEIICKQCGQKVGEQNFPPDELKREDWPPPPLVLCSRCGDTLTIEKERFRQTGWINVIPCEKCSSPPKHDDKAFGVRYRPRRTGEPVLPSYIDDSREDLVPERDDEACGIGGKPPKYQGDSGVAWGKLELSSMLRESRNNASLPASVWDAFIARADELEEKAKKWDKAEMYSSINYVPRIGPFPMDEELLRARLEERGQRIAALVTQRNDLMRTVSESGATIDRLTRRVSELEGVLSVRMHFNERYNPDPDKLAALTRQRDGLAKLCEEMILSYVHATDDSGVVSRVKGMKLLAWKSMYNAFTGNKIPKEATLTTSDCTVTGLTDPVEMLQRVKPIIEAHNVLGWQNLIGNVAGLALLCKSVIAKFRPIGFDGIHQATVQGHVCYEWETKFFQVTGRRVHP